MEEGKNKILLVEDNIFNSCAIESLFLQLNFECDTRMNGNEAIEAVRSRLKSGKPMYSLILMDYSMPDCDGTTAALTIREILSD